MERIRERIVLVTGIRQVGSAGVVHCGECRRGFERMKLARVYQLKVPAQITGVFEHISREGRAELEFASLG